MEDNVDDVAFIRALLDDLMRAYQVDAKRVYATGMSNGAIMAYRLASELSDRIAAIAPVAGAVGTEDEQAEAPGAGHALPRHGGRECPVQGRQGREDHHRHEFLLRRSLDPDLGEGEWLRREAEDRTMLEETATR